MKFGHWFGVVAHQASRGLGSPLSFAIAALIVIGWACSGPLFGYSDTWQLVINTGTTIITFLMVFLIQNTQNRDSAAIHLKLDELVRALADARNSMIALEDLDDIDLQKLQAEYRNLATQRQAPGGSPTLPLTSEAKPDADPQLIAAMPGPSPSQSKPDFQ